jgi:membrane protease YdiL (CAAX protease family)
MPSLVLLCVTLGRNFPRRIAAAHSPPEDHALRGPARKLALFLPLTFALSAVFYALIARAGTLQTTGGLYVVGLMWSPGVAALATQLITEGNVNGLGWRSGKTRYLLLSVALPLGLVGVTYAAVWLTGLGGFPNMAFIERIAGEMGFEGTAAQTILIFAVVSSTFGLMTASATALGEEIGWRGLLVPALNRLTGFTGAALISGAVWAVWHYPLILFADYRSEAPPGYALACFTVMAVAFGVVMAWMRLKSGSLWTAVLLHAAHNVFVQTIFTPLTADTGPTKYVVDEFGAGLAVAYLLAAVVFWRMRDQLPAPERGPAA